MSKKTILFINMRFSDFYSQDLFSALKESNNYRVVAVLDQHFKEKMGDHVMPFLDAVYYLNCRSKDGFLAEFAVEDLRVIISKELANTQDLHLVCTDEFNLLVTGQLRREFKLSGHDDKTLLAYRDKHLMKNIIAKQGLRVPKHAIWNNLLTFTEIAAEFGLPFIIKPIDSCGSHGVHKIQTQIDYNKFYNAFSTSVFTIEEFIQGKLYHVDSWKKHGELKFICANEYSYPNFEYTKGKPLASIPLNSEDLTAIRLIAFAKQCLQALEANNMINHMELFITDQDELVFLEVSGRPPGALLNLTHQINFGVNLMDEDFFMQTDISLTLSKKISNEKVFAVLFPLQAGTVKECREPRIKSHCKMTWFVQAGSKIHQDDCLNVVNKAALAVVSNSDINVLRNDFQTIKNHKALEMLA